MPVPAAAHRANITLTMNADLAGKIDRVVEQAHTTKNALICGVFAALPDDELVGAYRSAVERGLVSPRGKITDEQKLLQAKLSTLSPEKVKELLLQLG